MAIPNRQIGWSNESNLLWNIWNELDKFWRTVGSRGTTNNPVNVTLPAVASDAFGRQRVSEPLTLFDSSHRYSDNGLWSSDTVGGLVMYNSNQGLIDLTIGVGDTASIVRETIKVFSYQPGKSLLVMNTFVMNAPKAGLTQRVGYYGAENGFYLEQANSDVAFVKRSLVTGSVVNTPVLQADWNGDKLDGNGPSGLTLDLTKAQILWMDVEWLGVGSVRMGFVINGQFILCHTFHHANIIASTYITTASLPLRYEIFNTAETTEGSVLKQICSTVISEGGYELRGEAHTASTAIGTPYNMTVASTYYPIVSIRLKSTNLDGIVIPTAMDCLPISTGTYEWRLVEKGTTTGGTWVSAGVDSVVEYNITGTSFSGGDVVHSGFFNASNQGTTMSGLDKDGLFDHQLTRDSFTSTPYEFTLVVAANTVGGGGSDVLGHIDWDEISR